VAGGNFLNPQWVSMEILRLAANKLTVMEYMNRSWQKDFDKEFAPGSQITVKFPQLFIPSDGMAYQPQSIARISTPITLNQWVQIAFEWDDYEDAVKLERSESELRQQYWEPAAAALAQEWDSRAANFALNNTNNYVGTLGTDPTTVQPYYQARQRLQELAAPPGKRGMMISSSMMASLGVNITNVFHPGNEISRMWKDGYIGELAGFDFFESNSIYTYSTGGTFSGTTNDVVSGANQSGTAIKCTLAANDIFQVGDKITFASVYQVNPMTRRYPGKKVLKQFVVTQAVTGTGVAGADTLNILPPIYGPGSQYQNVDSLPADAAQIGFWGSTAAQASVATGTVGLALTPFAFAFVGAKLYQPKAVEESSSMQDPDTRVSLRKVKAWDPVRSVQINRLDSLGGFGNLYQDRGAVAVVGA